jgi:putative heme-binding domain-containing protein
VHPVTGDLFVSIGGRGTRGAVYRIRHPEGLRSIDKQALAKMRVPPRSLDWRPELQKDMVDDAKRGSASERLAALIAIRRHRDRWEAKEVEEFVFANWGYADCHVRRAAADLMATLPEAARRDFARAAQSPVLEMPDTVESRARVVAALQKLPWRQMTYCQASVATELVEVIRRTTQLLGQKEDVPVEARLVAVRLLQLALGDLGAKKVDGTIWEGYTPRRRDLTRVLAGPARTALRAVFPAGQADLDREISRTLAMLEDNDASVLQKVADRLTATSPPVEDIHYLTVLARLRAPRSAAITRSTATALLALDAKLNRERAYRDSHWPLRIGELHVELARQDAALDAALLAHAEFGRPDHALFAVTPGFDRRRAAAVFLARSAKEPDYAWNASLIELISSLPAEKSMPVLRRLWGQAGLDEAILPVLAEKPEAADRDKFLTGLSSPQVATVRRCLEALDRLPGKVTEGELLLPLVVTLRRLGDTKDEKQMREQVVKYLQRVTGQDQLGADKEAWAKWFGKTYPKLARRLSGPDSVDVEAWERRLAKVDWAVGDPTRGKAVFTKASCASCHSGAQALGPDLRGVTGRFSRDDVLTAIIQPSKDISPRYRTTKILTAEGRAYEGLVIYDAVDSVILQTGAATTIRLVNKQIASRQFTDVSLMPVGLLDKVEDRDIADLYAYLKSLGSTAPKK